MLGFFYEELSNLKSGYPFIFGERESSEDDDEVSLNYSEKQEFLEEYGAYMEIIYLVCQGNLLEADRVTEMPATKFLFLGEYLLRKRNIENKK